MATYIETLKKQNGDQIAPRTVAEAVTTSKGEKVEDVLSDLQRQIDESASEQMLKAISNRLYGNGTPGITYTITGDNLDGLYATAISFADVTAEEITFATQFSEIPVWELRIGGFPGMSSTVKKITIPETFSMDTVIGNSGLAFPNLEEVNLASNVVLGEAALTGTKIRSLKIPRATTSVPYNLCAGCEFLENVTFEESYDWQPRTIIEGEAFRACHNLKGELHIPIGIESVGCGAYGGTGYSVAYLPASLKYMEDCFDGCPQLHTIYCDFNEGDVEGAPWGAEYATVICLNSGPTTTIQYQYTETSDGFGYWICVGIDEQDVQHLIIPNYDEEGLYPVMEIADNAFSQLQRLRKVTLSLQIVFVGDGAFKNCPNLKTISFNSVPEYIGLDAFEGCDNLTDIYVPWSQGDVPGEDIKWGAPDTATIHFDSEVKYDY